MKVFLFLSFLTTSSLIAQLGLSNPREVTDVQARQIFTALRATGTGAKDVVYPIYSGGKRISYGISLGGGRLLTKARRILGTVGSRCTATTSWIISAGSPPIPVALSAKRYAPSPLKLFLAQPSESLLK